MEFCRNLAVLPTYIYKKDHFSNSAIPASFEVFVQQKQMLTQFEYLEKKKNQHG